ncbi:SPOR domain-containing protein [Litorilituus sediminis]|uniref:DedD protein n=1 Tax=Litorilituus sediminis TaxID=718192 RepID=A0A4P6P6Q9_9GAMM|nr:SPOR domain-containing protein [Litorilituus sediminis]QBG37416.1 dedD protein [Litorilituus sediminis]
MSTPFQNRLVGTIIVAAIIVIFLPDILDGKKNSNKAEFESIPQTPVFQGKLTDRKFPTDKLESRAEPSLSNETALDEVVAENDTSLEDSAKEAINISIEQETSTAKISPAKQDEEIVEKVATSALPEKAEVKQAWVIHLGSFKHKQNVAQLLAKLKDNGYTAFTRPIKTKQGTLTKVFIGPELIKSSLTKKLPALKKLTNTQGKVAPFEPLK